MSCVISSHHGRSVVLAACVLGLASCAIEMQLPEDFLQLESPPRQLKATTPDQARLWVREFEDRDQGTLSFWASTLENDFVNRRGYRLVGADETSDAEGLPGIVMELAATVEGEQQGYLVALFVGEGTSSNTIRVVEFVAREPVFAQYEAAVRNALRTLQP